MNVEELEKTIEDAKKKIKELEAIEEKIIIDCMKELIKYDLDNYSAPDINIRMKTQDYKNKELEKAEKLLSRSHKLQSFLSKLQLDIRNSITFLKDN